MLDRTWIEYEGQSFETRLAGEGLNSWNRWARMALSTSNGRKPPSLISSESRCYMVFGPYELSDLPTHITKLVKTSIPITCTDVSARTTYTIRWIHYLFSAYALIITTDWAFLLFVCIGQANFKALPIRICLTYNSTTASYYSTYRSPPMGWVQN